MVTQGYGYGGEGGWKVSAMTAVMKDVARMMEIEFVHITRDTTAESLEEPAVPERPGLETEVTQPFSEHGALIRRTLRGRIPRTDFFAPPRIVRGGVCF